MWLAAFFGVLFNKTPARVPLPEDAPVLGLRPSQTMKDITLHGWGFVLSFLPLTNEANGCWVVVRSMCTMHLLKDCASMFPLVIGV